MLVRIVGASAEPAVLFYIQKLINCMKTHQANCSELEVSVFRDFVTDKSSESYPRLTNRVYLSTVHAHFSSGWLYSVFYFQPPSS